MSLELFDKDNLQGDEQKNMRFKIGVSMSVISLLVVFFGLFLFATGIITPTLQNGFAVDADKYVFVGKDTGGIEVYHNQTLYNRFSKPATGGYLLGMKDDRVVIETGRMTYYVDREGNYYSEEPSDGRPYNALQFTNKRSSSSGEYELIRFLGRTGIVEKTSDGEVLLYQIDLFSLICKYLLCFSWVGLLLGLVLCIPRFLKT